MGRQSASDESDIELAERLEASLIFTPRNVAGQEMRAAITEAVRRLRVSHEPCEGCEQYAVMHSEIALALDIHETTDAQHLQELILGKLRAAPPPADVLVPHDLGEKAHDLICEVVGAWNTGSIVTHEVRSAVRQWLIDVADRAASRPTKRNAP